jgi:dienelactone hydrolase
MEKKKSSLAKRIGIFAVTLCLGIGVGLSVYIADGIRYPVPDGEYQVGRTKMYLTDSSREEIFSEETGDKRELPVTIYYPADPKVGDRRADFASKAVADAIASYNGFPTFVLDTVKPNSFIDAEPVSGETFPVLMFSEGLYGQASFYGSLLEAVASQGYIIVSVEHPYSDIASEASDGSIIRYNNEGTAFFDVETDNVKLEAYGEALADVWTSDMLFVYDELANLNKGNEILAGTMNLEKTGIFGHSFGGAVAVQCLQEREELIAGINMDGSLFGKQRDEPVYQPIVFMNSSQGAVLSAIFFQEKVIASQTSEACYHMMLLDSTHDSFAPDSGLLYDKFPIVKPADAAKIPGGEALSDLSFYITAFFDQYILGQKQEAIELGFSEEHLHIMWGKYDKTRGSKLED